MYNENTGGRQRGGSSCPSLVPSTSPVALLWRPVTPPTPRRSAQRAAVPQRTPQLTRRARSLLLPCRQRQLLTRRRPQSLPLRWALPQAQMLPLVLLLRQARKPRPLPLMGRQQPVLSC